MMAVHKNATQHNPSSQKIVGTIDKNSRQSTIHYTIQTLLHKMTQKTDIYVQYYKYMRMIRNYWTYGRW